MVAMHTHPALVCHHASEARRLNAGPGQTARHLGRCSDLPEQEAAFKGCHAANNTPVTVKPGSMPVDGETAFY